jgi:hypothetical protein
VEIEGSAQSADRKPGLQLKHPTSGGFGRGKLSESCLRCRKSNKCHTPIRICLKYLVRSFGSDFIFAALKMAESNRKERGDLDRIERTQTERSFTPFDGAIRIARINPDDTA